MINIQNENYLNFEECNDEKKFFKFLDRYKKDDKIEYFRMKTNDKTIKMVDIGLSDVEIIKFNKTLDELEIIQDYGYDDNQFVINDDEKYDDNMYFDEYEY